MAALELVESYRAKAGRYAIRSLYRGRIDGPETALKAVFAARVRWRWFVDVMAEAGWPQAGSELHVKYLRNCPMFGVTTVKGEDRPPKSRACLRALYCPFCYAREYPVNAYDRLVGLLPEGKGERVLYGTEWAHRIDPNDYETYDLAYEAAAAVVKSPLRRAEVDAADPLGAVVFHRVKLGLYYNPTLDRDEVTSLTVLRTTLMVCPKGRKVRVPGGIDLSITDDPGKRELAGEVGRLFRYPVDWYEAPLAVVAQLGRYVAKARVFSAFGACRRKTATEKTE